MRYLLLPLAILLAACTLTGGNRPTGTLEGKVTVGPLTPVVRAGEPEPTPPPEVFTSRGLAIFKADGQTLVKRLAFQADGTYQVELPAGQYVVDLDHQRNTIEHARGLPAQVEIRAGEITQLDIDIDTGIR